MKCQLLVLKIRLHTSHLHFKDFEIEIMSLLVSQFAAFEYNCHTRPEDISIISIVYLLICCKVMPGVMNNFQVHANTMVKCRIHFSARKFNVLHTYLGTNKSANKNANFLNAVFIVKVWKDTPGNLRQSVGHSINFFHT